MATIAYNHEEWMRARDAEIEWRKKNPYAIGTKFTRSGVTAIVTEDGVLSDKLYPTRECWEYDVPPGQVTIEYPAVPQHLRERVLEPLTTSTDAGKLEELQLRFPGAEFKLWAGSWVPTVWSSGSDIWVIGTGESHMHLQDFYRRSTSDKSLCLIMEYQGHEIDMMHLF
jgi:hypothetical protein